MSDALVPYEAETTVQEVEATPVKSLAAMSPFDLDPAMFKAGLDRRMQNRKALLDWLAGGLVRDVDFGKIHIKSKDQCDKGKWCKTESHFSKDVLFKPGAEKICSMLGLTPIFPMAPEYEQKALKGEKFEWIVLRCDLISASGQIVSSGIGSRRFSGDLNKDIKMAEKSGQIDATIRIGLSDCYTQDLEDMSQDLTPALEASLEQVKARKAGNAMKVSPEGSGVAYDAKGWDALKNRKTYSGPEKGCPPIEVEVDAMGGKAEAPEPVGGESEPEVEPPASIFETAAPAVPGHCTLKGCKGEIEIFKSRSEANQGREYWACVKGQQLRDQALMDGSDERTAAIIASAHFRQWVE